MRDNYKDFSEWTKKDGQLVEGPYRGWYIQCAPPPIPIRAYDWHYWHKDYDGPDDARTGSAQSLTTAMAEIDAAEGSIAMDRVVDLVERLYDVALQGASPPLAKNLDETRLELIGIISEIAMAAAGCAPEADVG